MIKIPWFYVDDAFANSKPVMALDRSLRNEAIGLWVRCGAWSAQEETDGRVPLDTVKSFDGTPRLIRALHEQAGLWGGENLEISPDSWRDSREISFKNWEKWQKTRAENIAKRKADAARQASHRRAKKGRNFVPESEVPSADTETSHCDTNRDSDPDVNGSANSRHGVSHSAPTQTRPDPTLIPLETSSGGVTSVDAREAPRPQCIRHPHENAKTRCADCKARREWDEAEAARAKADEIAERRRRREAIDACDLCDRNGKVETSPNSLKTCTHPNAQEAANA